MKKFVLLILITVVTGCSEIENSNWKSNPKYRAYISTRLADAIIEYDILTDEIVVEEQCDGSGWITQGDGHRTECPGCESCEKEVTEEIAEEIAEETIEEINLPSETKPKTINQTKTKIKRPLSKIFNRKRR